MKRALRTQGKEAQIFPLEDGTSGLQIERGPDVGQTEVVVGVWNREMEGREREETSTHRDPQQQR